MDEQENASSAARGRPFDAWRRGLGAATAAVALAWPAHALARCQISGIIELPVTMVGARAIARVGINGTDVPLVVDTGAFYSMLTDAAAAQLKLPVGPTPHGLQVLGLTGTAVTHMTTVDKLHLLGGDLPDAEFLVGGNESGAGAMGIMGRNLLAFTDTEYDLAHGAIRFVFPNKECGETNMAYWAGSTPVSQLELVRSYGDKTPSIRARIKLNDHKVLALFDTGAMTLVSLAAAHRAGIETAAMTPAFDIYGIGRGRTQGWTAAFDKVDLGDEAILHNHLAVADFQTSIEDIEMLLGMDFFLSHRIYVSKKQSKMYFTYSGGPVFALNKGQAASAVAFDAPRADSAASAASDAGAASTESDVTADQLARRGAASAARRDYAGALADLDRACAMAPTTASFFAQRGIVHELAGHKPLALLDFDKALALDPAQADARFHRAAWRAAMKDRDGAQQDLAALDKVVPAQAPLRLAMAHLYAALDQPAQVVLQLDAWIPAHPHDLGLGSALNSRCWARVLLDQALDKAYDDCDAAVDTDSKNPAFRDSLAWVLLRQGKFKKAVGQFDRSLELRPAAAGSLYGRGVAKLRLGDKAAGQADLDAAAKAQPAIEEHMQRIGLSRESLAAP